MLRTTAVLLFSTTLAIACSSDKAATAEAPAVGKAINGVVTVNVGAEFTPSRIEVEKGKPLQIKFVRGNEPSCGDEVVFPALKIRKQVPANSTTVVDLAPQQSGTLAFTCGMKMMKGAVVVQ